MAMLTTLTQGHLKLLEDCPRRFQYAYLDQFAAPINPDTLDRQQWGQRFHLIMQQRQLGLTVDPLLAANPELGEAVKALTAAAPDLLTPVAGQFRQSEHRRSLAFNGYVLTVIYDLLLLSADEGSIIDWKTHLQPLKKNLLAKDWQTRLYLYVLVETTKLQPDQVNMAYWFVRHRDGQTGDIVPQQVLISYSSAKHRRTRQDLQRLTSRLRDLARLRDLDGEMFPQIGEEKGRCDLCPFAVRCQRLSQRYGPSPALTLPSLEEIAEVPL